MTTATPSTNGAGERLTVPDTPLARRATAAEAFLKVMVWAEPGYGKSRLALSFPSPMVADLERSTALYADEFDFLVAEPSERMKPHQLVYALMQQIQRGMYPDRKTLVIDPATDYLEHLETALIDRLRDRGVNLDALTGLARAKAYAEVNEGIRRELGKLLTLPMHVVFVVRAKNQWGKNKDGKMDVLGRQPDIKDVVPYLADIVLKLEKGGEAIVEKSRLASLPPRIKAATYAHIAEALDKAKVAPYQAEPDGIEPEVRASRGGS